MSRAATKPAPDLLAPVVRWSPNRKQRLVEAVAAGEIGRDEALARHGISSAEFDRWAELTRDRGMRGLKVTTRVQGGPTLAEAPIAPAGSVHWRQHKPRGWIG